MSKLQYFSLQTKIFLPNIQRGGERHNIDPWQEMGGQLKDFWLLYLATELLVIVQQ